VGVAYGSDTEKVRSILERVATSHAEVLDEPAPTVRFMDFGDSSLDFSVFFWINNPLRLVPVESDIRYAIDAAFREQDVEIPFPQRDLHMRSGWPQPN
jgi:small-conductance mechanosensitive channel